MYLYTIFEYMRQPPPPRRPGVVGLDLTAAVLARPSAPARPGAATAAAAPTLQGATGATPRCHPPSLKPINGLLKSIYKFRGTIL